MKKTTKPRGRGQRKKPSTADPINPKTIQFVTPKEFAARCKLSLNYVHTLLDTETVKSVTISPPGRKREVRRILESELVRYAQLAGLK